MSQEEVEDNRFMAIAIDAARKAAEGGCFPVGAAVVLGGKLLAVSDRDDGDFHCGHAEVLALRRALAGQRIRRSEGLTIYSTLEPCVMCLGTILHCPIARLIYSLEDPWGGATSLLPSLSIRRHLGKVPHIRGGVLRNLSKDLLRAYFANTQEPIWRDKSNPLVQMVTSND